MNLSAFYHTLASVSRNVTQHNAKGTSEYIL